MKINLSDDIKYEVEQIAEFETAFTERKLLALYREAKGDEPGLVEIETVIKCDVDLIYSGHITKTACFLVKMLTNYSGIEFRYIRFYIDLLDNKYKVNTTEPLFERSCIFKEQL